MKLVFEPGEKELIEETYKRCPVALFQPDSAGKEFGLTIEITNPALADPFVSGLLNGRVFKDDSIDLGFKVNAVHFRALLNKDELKSQVIQAIEKTFDL